jgi:muramoyltetrapeptide carboxypeptidase
LRIEETMQRVQHDLSSILNPQSSIPLQRPKALKANAHLAVLAASGPSELERIHVGVRNLERMGFRVTLADNIDRRHRGYLAGDDDLRVQELNRFLRDSSFDGFLFARGGYGVMRILDRVDYDAIAANPRPIIGFSDLTALHQAIAVRTNVATFHGPMVNLDFHDGLSPDVERWFLDVLGGAAPLTWNFEREDVLQEGEAEGPLVGGCLSLTNALTGTPYDYWIDGGIWFWEEVDEKVYSIDRMLTHLRLSGRIARIRAVVIGKLKGCGSESEILALLHEFFGSFDIPVIRNLPFGHHGNNLLMPIGTPVRLSTANRTLTLTESAVV